VQYICSSLPRGLVMLLDIIASERIKITKRAKYFKLLLVIVDSLFFDSFRSIIILIRELFYLFWNVIRKRTDSFSLCVIYFLLFKQSFPDFIEKIEVALLLIVRVRINHGRPFALIVY